MSRSRPLRVVIALNEDDILVSRIDVVDVVRMVRINQFIIHLRYVAHDAVLKAICA